MVPISASVISKFESNQLGHFILFCIFDCQQDGAH